MALKTHYEMKNWSWQQDGYVEEEEEEREEREEEKENASSASALKPSWATYVDGREERRVRRAKEVLRSKLRSQQRLSLKTR